MPKHETEIQDNVDGWNDAANGKPLDVQRASESPDYREGYRDGAYNQQSFQLSIGK